MEETVGKSATFPWEKVILGGCLSCSCLIFLTFALTLVMLQRETIPYVRDYFPTATATPAQILVGQPPADEIIREDFTNNRNNWASYYSMEKTEVRDGKLFLEAFSEDAVAMAYCETCPFSSDNRLASPYYLQAEFASQTKIDTYYGLVFGLLYDENSYYAFLINPVKGSYSLLKLEKHEWSYLRYGESKLIRQYPNVNTLSVDFDQGVITLYINGTHVDSYADEAPNNSGAVGVISNATGFQLIVDNLFAYNKK